ncbi:hypothetical protein SEVIR_5G146150v4 [Setaria viridis]
MERQVREVVSRRRDATSVAGSRERRGRVQLQGRGHCFQCAVHETSLRPSCNAIAGAHRQLDLGQCHRSSSLHRHGLRFLFQRAVPWARQRPRHRFLERSRAGATSSGARPWSFLSGHF